MQDERQSVITSAAQSLLNAINTRLATCGYVTSSRSSRLSFVLLLFGLVGLLLLLLTWDLRPFPIAGYLDDYRYVLSADHIKDAPWKMWKWMRGESLDWLGPYDPTTLFKRPGISIVLATLTLLHLPFIQTTLLLHLAGIAVLSNSLLRLNYSRYVVAAFFVVVGLLPTLYDSNAVRVIREITTGALELTIFGLCLSLLTLKAQRMLDVIRSGTFVLLLVLLALHWSMREEAVLLIPAVLLLVNSAVWLRVPPGSGQRVALSLILSVLVLLPSQVAYLSIAGLNKISYGVFLVNEVSEGSFPRAVSELKRVEESPCDHRLLTAEEVQRVMAVSESFRVVGETLATALSFRPDMIYTDAFSVMRYAALRDTEIGRSPHLTQDLFSRIGDEVEAACEDGRLDCAKNRSGGIVPFLCPSQWALVPASFGGYVLDNIVRVSNSGVSPLWSGMEGMDRLHPAVLADFEAVTRQEMAGRNGAQTEYSQPAVIDVLERQDALRSATASRYAKVMPWLMLAGVIAIAARLPSWRDPERRWWLVVLAAMGGHVFARAGAFAYLSTVDGYLNTRYISVSYPIAAAFAVLAVGEAFYIWPFRYLRGTKARREEPRSGWSYRWLPVIFAAVVIGSFVWAGGRVGNLPEAELPLPPFDGALVRVAGETHIDIGGRQIEIVEEAQGFLYGEAGWLRGESAVFDGWGMDVSGALPAQAILVFIDERLAAVAETVVPVPEVESGFPPDSHAGFTVSLPRRVVDGRRVRVFALLDGDRAGELNYPAGYLYLD